MGPGRLTRYRLTGQSWQLVFAMGLTGAIFLVWVMIMAYQVFVNS